MALTSDAQKAIARARSHSFGPMGDILKLLADAAEIANDATMSISADGQKAVARAKAESFGDDEDVRKLLAAVAEGLAAGGGGTVTSVSVVPANGVSATVADPTTTPALTFTLGAITPTTVVASGNITAPAFIGVGTSLTALAAPNITLGLLPDARLANTIARTASPQFTGQPKAPTPPAQDDSTTLATTAFVKSSILSGIVTEATTARILDQADAGKYIRCTNAGATTLTIWLNASSPMPVGAEITIRRAGGPLSLVITAGVTVNNSGLVPTIALHGNFTLKKIATDIWDAI